jgi:hypothetical protein
LPPAQLSFWNDFCAPVLGLLVTALAAMLGAPFWFDVLNKVMVIRSTVKPHQKSPEEASDDRQLGQRKSLPALAPPIPLPVAMTLAAGQPDNDVDGCACDVPIESATPDDALPHAKGGVA